MGLNRVKQGLPLLAAAAAAIAALLLFVHINLQTGCVLARDGLITLPQGQFGSKFLLAGGNWLEYQGLYTPQDIGGAPPALSKDLRYETAMVGHTYRVTLNSEDFQSLYCLLPRADGCRLFIDGEEVFSPGGSALSARDLVSLAAYGDGQGVDILLQVFKKSAVTGSFHGLILGAYADLSHVQDVWMASSLTAIGIYILLIINLLSLYILKHSERYLLILCAIVLQALLKSLTIAIYPAADIFGLRLGSFAVQLARLPLPFRYYLLQEIFPGVFPKGMRKLFNLLFSLACGLSLLSLSMEGAALALPAMVLQNTIFLLEGGCIIYGCLRQGSGRNILLFVGFLAYGLYKVFLLLIARELVPAGVVDNCYYPNQYMHLCYVLSYAIAINGKFTAKFREAEELGLRLSVLNNNLEDTVNARTAELKTSYEQLLSLQEEQRRFLGNIAHNLRSPLFSVNGALDMLKKQAARGEDIQPRVEALQGKMAYVERMIQDLFFVLRFDSGRIRFNFLRFDVAMLLKGILADRRMEAPGLDMGYSGPEKLSLSGDSYYLRQVFENILDNALRHAGKNGSIRISLEALEGQTHISIANNGDPISPEDMPRIFDRYYKGQTHGEGQTGLGLSIAKDVVEGHGGKIWAESGPQSTRFHIALPYEDGAAG